MPSRSGAGYRDVVAWIVAGTVLLACWMGLVRARRRAVRRAAAARDRLRAKRPRVPLVSANLRGQATGKPDIWRDAAEAAPREQRPT